MADVDVVVVGAGFAGMMAARRLTGQGFSVRVLEREQHSGGRVRTERHEGAYLEHGGIFHTRGYPALLALLDELGLADASTPTPTGFHAAVRRDGRFRFVDYGSPTGPLRTGALGWLDKLSVLRTALPALLARPSDLGDLTTAAGLDTRAVTDTLTTDAADYFTAGPHEFLWGVSSDRLSLAMLAVQLHVFRGALREVRGGMGQVAEGVAKDLDIAHGTTVTGVASTDDGVEVAIEGGEPVRARAAVLACPSSDALALWPDAPAAVADHLRSMGTARIDYVYLRTRIPLTPEAEGGPVGMEVVTRREVGRSTLGGIYVANDWTSDGSGMLLVTAANVVGAGEMSDDELADRLQADAEKLHPELVGQVTRRTVMRHDPYTPVFGPGSVQRLAAVRALLPSRRIDLAGDHMSAPWLEGAIRSGQQAADRVTATLR